MARLLAAAAATAPGSDRLTDERTTLQRAQQAQTLHDNPLLTKLLDEIEDETVARWVAGARSSDERETCWQLMQALLLLRTKLEAAIGGGSLLRARQGRAKQ